MTGRLRVGVIGAGIADLHLEAYAELRHLFAVPVLCSLDEARSRALCERHRIADYSQDYDAVLARGDLDVVDIATPPHTHFALARKAIAAGCHVICEKPLFGSLAEVDAMEKILAGTDRRVMPIFQFRFGRGIQKLKRLVDLGLAGEPFLTTVETHWWRDAGYYAADWRGKWATELGGALLTQAIHAHDMLNLIHGPFAEVFAAAATRVNPIEVEDCLSLAVRMTNGSLAALSVTLGSRKEISRLRFCFRDLVAESNTEPYGFSRDPWRFVAGDERHQRRIDEALAAFIPAREGYARQFELFHAALASGGPLPVTLADARQSLALVTAAYHSTRTGRPAALPIGEDHPLYRSWLPERA